MSVSKVSFDGNDLINLESDTVTAASMLSGVTAHNASGDAITGTIATKTSSDLTASGATVTTPAGYYATDASKSVQTGSIALNTPSINTSTGVVTASANLSTAGYISSAPSSKTLALTTQAAKTVTPTTSAQTAVASGVYTTGAVTVSGDANLLAGNIRSGVQIFGVTGTYTTTDPFGVCAYSDEVYLYTGLTVSQSGTAITIGA